MDSMTWLSSLQDSLGGYLPSILGALAILLVGWIVALAASAATRKGLGRLGTNRRLSAQTESTLDFERIAGRIVFWTILLLAVIGMFGVLHVDGVSGPLSTLANTVMMYLPRLLLAIALAVIAWLVATIVRTVVNKALGATRVDEKLSEGADMRPISDTMGNVAYWLVLLLFLPAIVGALQIEGLMVPLSSMTTELVGMLPNLFAAAMIGLAGWIIAKALRGLVSNLLAATGVDRFSQQTEATRDLKLSQLGGTLVFILVIVPTLIAALDALRIEAISGPLTDMLDMFLAAVPHIIAAAAILIIAWFVGRFVADLATRLLANLGFDRLPERLGLGHALAPAPREGEFEPAAGAPAAEDDTRWTLSEFGGQVVLFFIMLFATVEAAHQVGFTGVRELLETFIAFGANVLLGLVIFVVGYWLANLAATAIERANPDKGVGLSRIARVAILGLVLAMGLRAMGIADEIVNLAFGLVLGAVAVAIALAFGLGGREAAGRIANDWAEKHLRR
ncbi:mechanosensitive ion channel [Marilutibacter chinensis]|uniref:Small-conductance mechanosensitive channel n=1 Tax=Marilutibacter chinensis TaxID=2912247 RepID=A0ABS9HY11_9GAMM|nr:mechanosensitive ion channel [Lysobacter chinensis]MCF7223230.1 mechanosensitive ion channel [Lysobacter chinensis]